MGVKKLLERHKELRHLVVTLQLLNGHPEPGRVFAHFVMGFR